MAILGFHRIVNGPGAGRIRHQAAFHDVRGVHHSREQHHRVGGLCVLTVWRAGLVRGRVQGTELHERQLAAGARLQSARPQARPVRQRLAHAARPHPQLHQEPLADGRGRPLFLPAANHHADQRQVRTVSSSVSHFYFQGGGGRLSIPADLQFLLAMRYINFAECCV